ncbi:MAG: hypothetical protein AB1898_30490 [Acidobacteriota bacterium]
MTDDIGLIIERSLARFITYVRENTWYGRENEAVSLYAFGFLQRECAASGPLVDPTQIGIEVGAASTSRKGRNARIRKDLVIWPQPAMNCWFPRHVSSNKPLAILEWKVCRPDARTPRGAEHDFAWLTAHTASDPECIAYSVEMNLATEVPSLVVRRFHAGESTRVEFK